jgi:hypothetical protein
LTMAMKLSRKSVSIRIEKLTSKDRERQLFWGLGDGYAGCACPERQAEYGSPLRAGRSQQGRKR